MRIPNGVMILPERLYVGSLGPPVVFLLNDTLTDDACTLVVRSDFGGFAGVPAVFSDFPGQWASDAHRQHFTVEFEDSARLKESTAKVLLLGPACQFVGQSSTAQLWVRRRVRSCDSSEPR